MKNTIICWICVLAGCTAACAQVADFNVRTEPAPGMPEGKVSGTVKDAQGNPMEFATVLLYQGDLVRNGAQVDVNGAYSIQPVAPGAYTVTIKYLSGTYSSPQVTVRPEERLCVEMKIRAQEEIWVADEVVSNAPIFINRSAWPEYGFGGWRIIDRRPEFPWIPIRHFSLLEARRPFTRLLAASQKSDDSLAYCFRGTVRDTKNQPIESAVVLLMKDDLVLNGAMTDNLGNYCITGFTHEKEGLFMRCKFLGINTLPVYPTKMYFTYDFVCKPDPFFHPDIYIHPSGPSIDLWETGYRWEMSRRITD